jgi:hypothetical protein
MKRELPVPDQAETADQAIEVIRCWIIDEALHCSISPKSFEAPEVWGRFLADVLELVSNALSEETGTDRSEILASVKKVFLEEADKIATD